MGGGERADSRRPAGRHPDCGETRHEGPCGRCTDLLKRGLLQLQAGARVVHFLVPVGKTLGNLAIFWRNMSKWPDLSLHRNRGPEVNYEVPEMILFHRAKRSDMFDSSFRESKLTQWISSKQWDGEIIIRAHIFGFLVENNILVLDPLSEEGSLSTPVTPSIQAQRQGETSAATDDQSAAVVRWRSRANIGIQPIVAHADRLPRPCAMCRA